MADPLTIDDGEGGTLTLEWVDESEVPADLPAVVARRFTGSLGHGWAWMGDGTADLLIVLDGPDTHCLTMQLTGLDPHRISMSKMLEAAKAGGGITLGLTDFAGWFGR